jgi:hypothetical protein
VTTSRGIARTSAADVPRSGADRHRTSARRSSERDLLPTRVHTAVTDVASVDGCYELNLFVGREQAFIAVKADCQFGNDIAK